MVYLPGHCHKVAIGSLWNMQDSAHTQNKSGGLVLSPMLWKGNIPHTSSLGTWLPSATKTEPRKQARPGPWMSTLIG